MYSPSNLTPAFLTGRPSAPAGGLSILGGDLTIAVKRCLSIFLVLSLVLCPLIVRSKVSAAAITFSGIIIALVLAVLSAMGITFALDGMDANNWLNSQLNSFFNSQGYTSVNDWLGSGWESRLSVASGYLTMQTSIWLAVYSFYNWLKFNGAIPTGGTVSNPAVDYTIPEYYIPSLTVGSATVTDCPVILYSDFTTISSGFYRVNSSLFFATLGSVDYATIDSWGSSSSVIGSPITYNSISISPSGYKYGNPPFHFGYLLNGSYSSPFIAVKNNASTYPFDTSRDVIWFLAASSSSSSMCGICYAYPCLDGYYYVRGNLGNYVPFPFVHRNQSMSISDVGHPDYDFNNVDPVAISLQIGQLTDVVAALNQYLQAVNNNLIQATIALQTANPGNLPVDTSSFNDLVEDYESLTNDFINQTISLSSCVSSMYSLLNASLASINNPSLADACINAYNAFLNKIIAFSQGSGSTTSQVVTQNVSNFQSILEGLSTDLDNLDTTLPVALSDAASALSTAIGNSSSLSEISTLNSIYNSWLRTLGIELELNPDVIGAVDDINSAVDDYLSGDLDRATALSDIRSAYYDGVRSAKTTYDLTSICTAYSTALDTLQSGEMSLSDEIGLTATEYLALEGDLIDTFNYAQFEGFLESQIVSFFPESESNLYKHYFDLILDETQSPLAPYIQYPLLLGILGLVLGSAYTLIGRRQRGRSGGKS